MNLATQTQPTRLTLPSRARVFDWILKFWVPRTGRLLPESNTTRLKYRSRSPTERSSRVQPTLLKLHPWIFRTKNRFTQADPSSEPLATAIESFDSFAWFRGFSHLVVHTFNHRLFVQASPPRSTLVEPARAARPEGRVAEQTRGAEPATDESISHRPRRAESSCHSSTYSAR